MTMKIRMPWICVIPVLLIWIFPDAVFAQGSGPSLPTAPDQAPIDGGLGLLAAAGGAYASRKFRKVSSAPGGHSNQ